MSSSPKKPQNILRRKQVEARVGLTRTTIYRKMSEGTFPLPISLGGPDSASNSAVGWLESEIDAWIDERIQQSRPTTKQHHTHDKEVAVAA